MNPKSFTQGINRKRKNWKLRLEKMVELMAEMFTKCLGEDEENEPSLGHVPGQCVNGAHGLALV